MHPTREERHDMFERLSLARTGVYEIARTLDLGQLLEEAQAAPNTRRFTFSYGSVIVVLHNARERAHLSKLVNDPTGSSTTLTGPAQQSSGRAVPVDSEAASS